LPKAAEQERAPMPRLTVDGIADDMLKAAEL